jgi:LPS-assembly protein
VYCSDFHRSLLLSSVLVIAGSLLPKAGMAVDLAWDCVSTPAGGWECSGVPKAPEPVPATPTPLPDNARIITIDGPTTTADKPAEPEQAAPAAVAQPAEPAPEPVAEPVQQAQPEPAPEPVQQAQPEAAPAAEPEQPQPAPAAIAQPAEPAPEPVAEPVQQAQPEPASEPVQPVQQAQPEPAVTPQPLSPIAPVAAETATADAEQITGTLQQPVAPNRKLADDRWEYCATPASRPGRPPSPPDGTASLSADQVELSKEKVSTFTGNVAIAQGDEYLLADKVIYDKEAKTVEASGNITYENDNMNIRGQHATVDLDTDKGKFEQTEYHLFGEHGRGTAAEIRQDERDKLQLTEVTYTTCDPAKKDWELKTEQLELDTAEDRGVARNVTLRFMDVPIFYSPYLSFPLSDKRKSGFLTPGFGSSDDGGFHVSAPYYWNIAPSRDATFTPTIIEDRGFQLGGEFRYLNPQYQGIVRAEYLPDDDLYQDQDREAFSFEHHQQLSRRWHMNIDYNYVSDDDYFEDLGSSLAASSRTHLPRQLDVAYNGNNWNFLGRLQGFQTIDDNIADINKPYQRLPQLLVNAYYPDQMFGLTYHFRGEVVTFDRSGSNTVEGTRLDLMPAVSLPMHKTWGYLTPKLGLRHTVYNLDNTLATAEDNPDRTLPIFSLDSGLFFDRKTTLFNAGMTHTLEPRAYYLYVPHEEQNRLLVNQANQSVVFDTNLYDFNFQQLFRENRFTGADRVGDANQLTLALTTRFLEDSTGYERLRASIGQIYYFRDREVTLPGQVVEENSTSDWVGELYSRLSNAWSTHAYYQYDTFDNNTERASLGVQYKPDQKHILNLAYRFDDGQQLEYTDMSARWPFTRHFYGVGRWYYSLQEDRTLEGFAGFEYDTCCWAVRLVGRRWFDEEDASGDAVYDDGIYLQLELKGLTNFGNKIENMLEEGILGYEK